MPALGLALGLPYGRSAAAPFTPEDLAALTNWWNIEDLAATGDGNPVSPWTSRVGAIALAAAGTVRPTYDADDGDGLPALQYDGVDDSLAVTASNAAVFGASGDAYEVWAAMKINGGADRSIFEFLGTSNGTLIYADATKLYWRTPTIGEQVTYDVDVRDGLWHVWRFVKDGDARIIARDGVELLNTTSAAGAYNSGNDSFNLGQSFLGAFLQGGYRQFLTFNDALSPEDADSLTTYLEDWI